jgi:hypothetical protein
MAYIGRPLNAGNLAVQSGTGDGSDTTPIATLDYSVGSSNSIGVYLDGVRQLAGTDFTAAGTTLTFTTAPANGVGIDVYFLGLELSIPTPADATVTAAKLASDAVTGAKIADDAIDSEHYTDGSIDLAHMSSESVDEDNLHISNAGSNGQFLSKQSGDAGGLTWAAAGLTSEVVETTYNMTTASGTQDITISSFGTIKAAIVHAQVPSDPMISWGFIDGSGDENVMSNFHSVQAENFQNNPSILITLYDGSSVNQACTASVITDGIRLTWTKQGSPSGTANIYCLFFK